MADLAELAFLRQFPSNATHQEITMFRDRLATTALTAAIALVPAGALGTAASAAAPSAHSPVVYGICANSAVVTKTPGKGFIGNLVRGETIKVKRVSRSGLYAYGFARGSAHKHGWIKVSAVCPHSGGLGDSRVQGTI